MKIPEKKRWKNWADDLRQHMMGNLTSEITKTVESIALETESTKPEKTLMSVRFWRDCQAGKTPHDHLAKAGFQVEFQPDEANQVRNVTLRLDTTWMAILQKVLDRQKK